MSDLYIIFEHREPLYHLGFFNEELATQLSDIFKDTPFSMRAVTVQEKIPALSRFEAKLLVATGEVLECLPITPEPLRGVSWFTMKHEFVFGRGFTEEEAAERAREARTRYLRESEDDDDDEDL